MFGYAWSSLDSKRDFKTGLDLSSLRMLVNSFSSSNEATDRNRLGHSGAAAGGFGFVPGSEKKKVIFKSFLEFWASPDFFEGLMKLLNHCGPRVLVKKCPLQQVISFSSVLTQIRKGFLMMKEGSNPPPLGHEAFRLPSVYSRLQ